MSHEFRFDVFLSHSSKDKALVRDIAERLRQAGLAVWFDEWVLKPGDSIPAKIEEGLEQSRVLVLCMSANAFGSDWTQLESQTFRFRDPLNRDRRFVPVRLDDSPVKGSLAQFLNISLLPDTREREYSKLIEACRLRRKRSTPPKKQVFTVTGLAHNPGECLERLLADGLERTEVLRAIREFHRAIWDYRDSREWVQRLSGEATSDDSHESGPSRSEIREYCGNRNVNAWQRAAATLPVILRAADHLGISTHDFKNAIAHSPHNPKWLNQIEKLVRRVQTAFEDASR